jgi:hypothetical protein
MDTTFIDDSTPTFNPLLSESGDEENESNDTEENVEPISKRQKRYNAEARRKVEDHIEMKRLEKMTRDFYFENS